MTLVSSIVIWTGEPFEKIRPIVESSNHLADAIDRSNVLVTRYTSVFTTILQNTEAPHVQQWIKEFTQNCDANGLDFYAVRFDPSDPMQTLSSQKNHLLSSSLRYLGDRVILYDMPLDSAIAAWAVREFLSIGWPTNDCLVVVNTPPDGAVHLAFCTSSEAYLRKGMLMFNLADYQALGLTSVTSLDDLCCLMGSAARRHGWGVKRLRWPLSSFAFWKKYSFHTSLVTFALWGAGVIAPKVSMFSQSAIAFAPLLSAACVLAMWRQKTSVWRASLVTLLFLPQAALWFYVELNLLMRFL